MPTDIHGNSVALDAVIADARSTGVDRWWLLGDLVAMGPIPSARWTGWRALEPEARILGNPERYVLRAELPLPPTEERDLTHRLVDQMVETAASFAWTRGSLAGGALARLHGSIARHATVLANGTSGLAVHASTVRHDGPA